MPESQLTVFELIALGRQPYTNWIDSLSAGDIEKINAAMRQTEITHLKNALFYELSDGQLQRVLIARALAQDTAVIILDEPTAHLDMHQTINIFVLLQKLVKETNKTIIISSHEINLAYFSESIKRSTDYLIPGDQTLSADMDKISRELDPGLAKLFGNVQNYYNKQQKLKSFENQKAELKNLGGSEFDYLPDSSEFDSAIDTAKKDLASSTITSEDELVAQRALDESYDSSKSKSFISNQRLKANKWAELEKMYLD